MKKTTLSYFITSFVFAAVAIIFAGILGYFSNTESALQVAIAYMISATVLGILETSVSLDNAVVNAKYLERMNAVSKQWFLTWGMAIAVFGMRLILPIAIVSLAAGVGPIAATQMALFDPELYQTTMESVHIQIVGFGAGFLMMVALEFFINGEKDHHWIPGLESFAALLGKFPFMQLLIGLPTCFIIAHFAPEQGQSLLYSSVA